MRRALRRAWWALCARTNWLPQRVLAALWKLRGYRMTDRELRRMARRRAGK